MLLVWNQGSSSIIIFNACSIVLCLCNKSGTFGTSKSSEIQLPKIYQEILGRGFQSGRGNQVGAPNSVP